MFPTTLCRSLLRKFESISGIRFTSTKFKKCFDNKWNTSDTQIKLHRNYAYCPKIRGPCWRITPEIQFRNYAMCPKYRGPCENRRIIPDTHIRNYAKCPRDRGPADGCRRAIADLPDTPDPECPLPCKERKPKKKGVLHRIKLRILEGGSNFGTPFRRVEVPCREEPEYEYEPPPPPKGHPEKKELLPLPEQKSCVQVAILGADSVVGQYIALLLKQCSCIKKLRLYESMDVEGGCNRDLRNVVQDLLHIDTSVIVQAYGPSCQELDMCLQNSDIVLILESGYINKNLPLEKRFYFNAPRIRCYADRISQECPRAFVIVCTSPVDCMVPLVAETLKETGWYDPRRLMGSMAVQEMQATTLAARVLNLDPAYTRVPCVGGTEGEALVPLFSKAVKDFDFVRSNAQMMTRAVRTAPGDVYRQECCCSRNAELSEAHALAGLVKNVAHALLCQNITRVSGYVETDLGETISPVRFIASELEIKGSGIYRNFGLPPMSPMELELATYALVELENRLSMVCDWYNKYRSCMPRIEAYQASFIQPRQYDGRFEDCAYAAVN